MEEVKSSLVVVAPGTAYIISLGLFLFRENLQEFTLEYSYGPPLMS